MKKLLVLIFVLITSISFAGTEAIQIDALWSGINNPTTGKSYSGAIVATFATGTSTAKAVWTNKAKTTPSSLGQSQFTLDSNGQAFVFGDGVYKINIYAPTDTGLSSPLITIDGTTYLVSGDSGISLNSTYDCDLPTALSALGTSDQVQLNVDCECIIASGTTVTITDNIATNVINGGSFDGVSGGGTETLNINGPLNAGGYAIIGDNLTVSGLKKLYPEWRGADPTRTTDSSTAILKTINESAGNPVIFNGNYLAETLNSEDLTSSGIHLIGNNSTIDGNDSSDSGFIIGGDMTHVIIEGFNFYQFGTDIISVDASTRSIANVRINNNNVTDSVDGFIFSSGVTDAIITENVFSNLSSSLNIRCIELGFDLITATLRERYVVSDNIFKDIVSSGSDTEVHAVLLYGTQVIVTGNIVDTLNNAGVGSDEAIYIKAQYGVVANNTIIDGGNGEAFINLKGNPRTLGTDMKGYGIVCENNTLKSNTTSPTQGINIQIEDATVQGNWVEGSFDECGIRAAGDNASIIDNDLNRIESVSAIISNGQGLMPGIKNITVKGNRITDFIGVAATTSNIIYLRASSTIDCDDWVIADNVINTYDDYVGIGTLSGIYIRIAASEVFNRLTIKNNDIYLETDVTVNGIKAGITAGAVLDGFYLYVNKIRLAGAGTQVKTNLDGSTLHTIATDVKFSGNDFSVKAFASGDDLYYEYLDRPITNEGASGTIKLGLPIAVVGLKYGPFIRNESQLLHVDPWSTDYIRGGGAGKYLILGTDGYTVTIECVKDGYWEIVAGYGTYTFEP